MYDFAVIGSGVSGGRIAHDLVEGGARCVLIEAGPAFDRKSFPPNEMDSSTRMFWGGGIEVTTDGRLGLLRARCLGGTSVVNQALLDRFDKVAFDDWQKRSGVSFLSREALDPHYDAVEKSLSVQSIPEPRFNRNARIFTQAFDNLGYTWKPLRRAQTDCAFEHGSDCIVCLGGCPRDSKQSTLVTSIPRAVKKGLALECDLEVSTIERKGDHVVVRGTRAGSPVEIRAKKVALAAGAIGNSALLLRSGLGESLPALGSNFSCHPQYMTYGLYDEPVDAHKGPLQSVKSEDLKLRRAGFKYENVFAPPIATAMLIPGMGREHMAKMKKYRYLASMETCVRDEPSGTIAIDRAGRPKVTKKLTPRDRERLDQGLTLVRDLFESTGAKEIIQCEQGFGLHLMGGCVMGADPAASVVSPEFQVHGCPDLFAADSSVFPSAPGINPSFTIMALSHKAAQAMLKR